MEDFLKILGVVTAVVLFIFIAPWLFFWIAYFGGWIAKITIGEYLVAGLGYLGLTVPLDKIPLLAATLGWFGGFFKSVTTATSHKN